MHPLAPLDCILMIFGCKIMIRSRIDRIMNILFLVIMIGIYAEDLAVNMDQYWKYFPYRPIGHIKYWCDTVFGIAFIFIMNRNRDSISQKLCSGIESLTTDQMSKLKCHSIMACFVCLLIRVIAAATEAVHLIDNNPTRLHILLDVSSHLKSNLNQWFTAGIFVYTFMVKMTAFREENYFKRLKIQIRAVSKDPESLAHERQVLSEERANLFQTLSIIPIFWFAIFFLGAASAIMDTTEASHRIEERLTSLIPYCASFALVFYLIFLCDSASLMIRSCGQSVISDLMACGKMRNYETLVTQLRLCMDTEFTAWSMFDINRRFVLSLISSLITFTVLFIQLASSAKS